MFKTHIILFSLLFLTTTLGALPLSVVRHASKRTNAIQDSQKCILDFAKLLRISVQQDTGITIENKAYRERKDTIRPELILKIAPTHCIDIFGSRSFLMSIERKSNNKSLSAEAGVFFPFIGLISKNRGWRLGTEYRIYSSKIQDRYLAISYGYKNQKFNSRDSIDIDNQPAYIKNISYSKQVHILSFIIGDRQLHNSPRFNTETYIGFGIRYKNTQVHGISQIEKDNIDFGDQQVAPFLKIAGRRFMPHILVGFRLIYLII